MNSLRRLEIEGCIRRLRDIAEKIAGCKTDFLIVELSDYQHKLELLYCEEKEYMKI